MAAKPHYPIGGYHFILKFDIEFEVNKYSLTLLDKTPSHKKVLRGTLLETASPATQWQDPKRGQKGNGKRIKLRCIDSKHEMECTQPEVARITRQERDMLAAIPTSFDRYTTYYKPEHLTRALALKIGSSVNVNIKINSMVESVPGIVQYIGEVPEMQGTLFGIELPQHRGNGTCDGEFRKKRFFKCQEDSAVFVSVNKLNFDNDNTMVSHSQQVETTSGISGNRLSAAMHSHRQSFVEGDLTKGMEVYVCSKKGSKEEWMKGKIIYIGKPPGEVVTYVGVEMGKPRNTRWDGYFKSHRLCTPLKQFYSELVQINDVMPVTLVENQESSCPATTTTSKGGASKNSHGNGGTNNKGKNGAKRPFTSNIGSNKNRASSKGPGYATKLGGSDTSYQKSDSKGFTCSSGVHGNDIPLQTLHHNNPYTPLAGSKELTNNRGADENLQIQKKLLDSAGKTTKEPTNAKEKEGRMKKFVRTKDQFLNKLTSLGGNKDGTSLTSVQADLPPISTHLLEEICKKVDKQWAYFGSNLRIDQAQIEKIAGKYEATCDRVLKILMYWWKDARKQRQAMQTLAYVLSELKLDILAGDILTEHFAASMQEGKMDAQLLEHVAIEIAKDWENVALHLGLEDDLISHIATASNIYRDRDRAKEMLLVWDKEISIACEKLSLLVRACKNSGFEEFANELEQGLDTDTLTRISRLVDKKKWRTFGEALGFSVDSLQALEESNHKQKVNLWVYTLLGAWRNAQPFSCDKILAISSALMHCEQNQLAWEICRGLDEDLLQNLAMKLQKDWRRLAEWLNLRPSDIQKLETDYPNLDKRTYMVLILWRKRQHAACDLLGELTKILIQHGYKEEANGLVDGLHDEILDKVATLSGNEWETLAGHLGFSEFDIQAICDAHLHEPQRVYSMLCQWRYRQHYTSNRVQALLDGLTKCGLNSTAEAVMHMMGIQVSSPVALAPGEVSDEQLQLIAKEIGLSWRLIALDLRFETREIHNLEAKYPNAYEQCLPMLLQWKSTHQAGYDGKKELINALEKSNRHDLVVSILGPRARMPDPRRSTRSSVAIKVESKPKPQEELSLNESQLFEIAIELGTRWKLVAQRLGFTAKDVMEIEGREKQPAGDYSFQMLQNWKKKLPPDIDAMRELEKALCSAGFKDLLSELFYNQEAHAGPSDPSTTEDISKELFYQIAKELDFEQLCKALNFGSSDVEGLRFNYQKRDQGCFQALDMWLRRGPLCRRKVSELFQVLQALNRPDLIQRIKSLKATKSDSDSIGELKPEKDALLANVSKLADNRVRDEDAGRLHSLSTYGVVEPAKEAIEGIEMSMDISPSGNPYGLEVNSMVEIPGKMGKLYGLIRWMGVEAKLGPMAGVELDEKLDGAGTDGILLGKRYFKCEQNKALFVKLSSVKPDSRFPSQIETFAKRSKLTSNDFGGIESPYVKGYIQPPTKLASNFVGRNKGIQGDQNSCYLDTTLFSMYAYSNIFDGILKREKEVDDLEDFEDVQRTLREHIVNPLRSHGFVRADRVIQLRRSLDKLGTTKGLTSEEKDPEEFLHTLLQEVTKTEPFLHIKHGDSQHVEKSYHYQIFMERNDEYQLPTVEQLLHYSFLHSDLKLTQVPPCLIMQMPRFGKDYRMYNRIMPSLYLDISDLLEGWPRICTMCGQLAECECRDCSGKISPMKETISSYCQDCYELVHQHGKVHKPRHVSLSDNCAELISVAKENGYSNDEIQQQIIAPRKMMELFAVVCIETSHYVAFVKTGSGPDADWVFFDSMADREGDHHGFNIPEITHLRDFKSWLDKGSSLMEVEDKELPSQLRRLLSDGYMCMYQDPAAVEQYREQYPTNTNLDEVIKNLGKIDESAIGDNMHVDKVSAGATASGNTSPNYQASQKVVRSRLSPSSPGGSVGASTSSAALAGYTPAHYQPHQFDFPELGSSSSSSATSPNLPYSTHLGPSHSNKSKAAAAAATTYQNYSDALSAPAPQYQKPPVHARGISRTGNRLANHAPPDYSNQTVHSRNQTESRNQNTADNFSQHVGNLPADMDYEMVNVENDGQVTTQTKQNYQMQLSFEADLYSKGDAIAHQQSPPYSGSEQSKYSQYQPVSSSNPVATPINVPSKYNQHSAESKYNGSSSFHQYHDDIKHPPHLEDVKHPPSPRDLEEDKLFGGLSHS